MKKVFLISFFIICSILNNVFAETAKSLQEEFIIVSENSGKAVVTVHSIKIVKQRFGSSRLPFRGDPFFEEFFKDFFTPAPQEKEYKMQGLGSGFIIDPKGYILTNEHVVEDSNEIEIILSDGRKFPASIVGSDKRSDIAVLKIEGENLPILEMGDSDGLKIGQWAIAVGNPFGHVVNNPDPTVTVGVVSALHRSLDLDQQDGRFYGNLIQTDAAINRGNSGGPLLGLNGKVIGINTLIFSTSGGYQGIGFAIPINKAKRIFEKIIKGKEITYPWLGIWIQPLNQDMMKQFNLDSSGKGALVFRVEKDSPAEKSGIKKGDVVLKISGKDVRNPHDLVNIVSSFEVGDETVIEIVRDGKKKELTVKIGARPTQMLALKEKDTEQSLDVTKKTWRGLIVEDITEQDYDNLNNKKISGVIVRKITPSSPAYFSGIKKGNIIDEIGRKPVTSAKEFYEMTKDLTGKILIHTNSGYFVINDEKSVEEEK